MNWTYEPVFPCPFLCETLGRQPSICTFQDMNYCIQTATPNGKYMTRLTTSNAAQAKTFYTGTVVHSGHRKRLVADGKVIAREVT